jgi:hypothetical protein
MATNLELIDNLSARIDNLLVKKEDVKDGFIPSLLLNDVKKLKEEFLALVGDYNTRADRIMNLKYEHYTEQGKKNAQKIERDLLVSSILPKADTLNIKVRKKALEVLQALNKARYPLTNSADTNLQVKGELQINNALLSLSSLKEPSKLIPLLESGIQLNKMDFVSALIDNFIANLGKDVVVMDGTINITPATDNIRNVEELNKLYDLINEYRLGIKFGTDTIAQLTLANKDIKFLSEQTFILLKVLNELGFVGRYTTGYDLQNKLINHADVLNKNSDLYKVLKFYPLQGVNFIEMFLKHEYKEVGLYDDENLKKRS